MADIKWIKITTDIFDDEKIKIIDTMPARDEIIVIWFKLLSLAGKVNQSGLLFMNSKIAYTPEMLAAIFNREANTVRLALSTFEQFEMISIEDNEIISICNWEKHQNVDGMDKINEQNRLRQQKYRNKQKALTNSNVTDNVTVTDSNAIEEDKNKDKNKDKDKENNKRKEPKKSKAVLFKQELERIALEKNMSDDVMVALTEFIEYRKSIKKVMTALAVKKLVNELYKITNDDQERIATLDKSIANGWTGIFKLKEDVRKATGSGNPFLDALESGDY